MPISVQIPLTNWLPMYRLITAICQHSQYVYYRLLCIQGYSGSPGINPRALQELFAVTEDRIKEWDYAITVSVMEIYNESIRDLLSDTPTESKEVKQSRNAADGHYVPGLTWIRVQTVDDVNEVSIVAMLCFLVVWQEHVKKILPCM